LVCLLLLSEGGLSDHELCLRHKDGRTLVVASGDNTVSLWGPPPAVDVDVIVWEPDTRSFTVTFDPSADRAVTELSFGRVLRTGFLRGAPA
jgi:hypothetical protein